MFITQICFTLINASGINNLHSNDDSEKFTFFNGVGVAMILMMQLSYELQTKKISAKILLFISGMSMYMLLMMYTADLTTEMTTGPGLHPVNNFDDVIKGDYKVLVKASTGQYEEMKNAVPGSAKHKVYLDQIKDNSKYLVSGQQQAIEMMNEDDKMLFFYTPTARFITDELKFLSTQG